MSRMMSCVAALLLIGAAQPVLADDAGVCREGAVNDERFAACNRLLAINPRDASAYNNRGLAYTAKGEYDRGIADLDEAVRLVPQNAIPYAVRGNAYILKGDYDRGIADLDRSIRLDPKNARAYNARGAAWNGKGDYDHAIADLDQAIRLDPKYGNPYSHRGFAYAKEGDVERGMADLDKALALNPKFAGGYINRAAIRLLRGDRGGADADYQTALGLDPNMGAAADVKKLQAALGMRPEQVAAPVARQSGQGQAPSPMTVPVAAPGPDLAACENQADRDLQRRIAACTRAIAANAGSSNIVVLKARVQRADLYAKVKQWDRVVGDADEIVRLAPEGQIRSTAERIRQGALAMLRQSLPGVAGKTPATAAAPSGPPSLDLEECTDNTSNDAALKVAACTRAIADNPGANSVLLSAYMARANLYQGLKQWDRVVADCDEILRLAPAGEIRTTAEGLRRVAVALARPGGSAPGGTGTGVAAVSPPAPGGGGSEAQWKQMNDRFADAVKKGDFGQGTMKLVNDQLDLARRAFGERAPHTLESLNNLADLQQYQGHPAEAEPLYQKELALRREAHVDRDPDTLVNLSNLANLYSQQGKYDQAEPLYREALQTSREVLGPRHLSTLTYLNNLGLLYMNRGRYGDAEPLLKEALQAVRETQGDRDPRTLGALSNLAYLYGEQGHYDQAEPLYKEVLQMRREVQGARHPDTLTAINNLGMLYLNRGRYGDAEPLLREALQTSREIRGDRHPGTLLSLNNLAFLYDKQGRFGEAEPLYQEALRLNREVQGPRNPATLTSLGNLAALYVGQGRYGDAEPLYGEELQGRREVLGPKHPDTLTTLTNLATLYQRQGRYGDAEPLLQEALQAKRETLGPRHPSTLISLNNLALLYQNQGRYGEAEPLLREALQTSREALGPRHPETLISLNNLATLYMDQGRLAEAEPLLKENLQTSREVLGERHPSTLTGLTNLSALYFSQGRLGEAEALDREALETEREVLGPRHPSTLTTVGNLAVDYADQRRFGDAEPLYREALQASREVRGARHPSTLNIADNLALLYDRAGRGSDAEPLYREVVQAAREVLGPRHPDTLRYRLGFAEYLVKASKRADAVGLLRDMERDVLGRIGQELHSTEAGAARRQLLSSQASFQDVVLSVAVGPDASVEARRLAATTVLQFKVLQGEEEAYLARLARRSSDPHVQALVTEIGRLRVVLAAQAQGAPEAFQKTLQELEAKQQELVATSPDYNDRLRVLNAGIDEVRKALPSGSALIEFRQFRPVDFQTRNLGEPRFAGVLLSGAAEPAVVDLGPVSALQPLAAALSGGTEGRGPAPGPQADAATPPPAAQASRGLAPAAPPQAQPPSNAAVVLYQRLLEPFKDAVAAAKTVYIAPDGILNLMPFTRLKLGDGRYWFEAQEVHVLQTGRDLLRPGADHPARGMIALGGINFDAGATAAGKQDDSVFTATLSDRKGAVDRAAGVFRIGFPALPATAAEAKEVTATYRKRFADEPAELWSGADAGKARLMALKSPPRVLHLATHGFYLPNQSREPMLLSGIALSGANRVSGGGNEGLLFALEAEGLNLDGTELVVLSACDTAKGDVDYSEGVFGLARALRTAGARNVLVTLWPLDDLLARDFMADFYRNWLSTAKSDPARALRDTQLQWIKQAGRSDPGAWAPYVVVE